MRREATVKKQERAADLKTAPKPENKNYHHFTPISGTRQHARGVFISINELPIWGQILSMFSPSTHSIALVRWGLGGENFGLLINVAVLLFYLFVFLFVGIRFHIINQKRVH